MKYIKTFEGRKPAYKFLSNENAEKIEEVVREFVKKLNVSEKIDKLKFSNFTDNLDYLETFEHILANGENGFGNGLYSSGNIYYVLDTFCLDNNMMDSKPELRNSLHDIISKLFIEYDIKNKLDIKLIEILEKKPYKYKRIFYYYEDKLSDNVKKSCQWMLNAENYNI